jgi:tRNA threonylcarbamoyladenosine modification (KEOPS) complex  Pcc1 subunit
MKTKRSSSLTIDVTLDDYKKIHEFYEVIKEVEGSDGFFDVEVGIFDNKVVITLYSDTLNGLRAAMNSYISWIKMIMQIIEIN